MNFLFNNILFSILPMHDELERTWQHTLLYYADFPYHIEIKRAEIVKLSSRCTYQGTVLPMDDFDMND